MKKRLIWKLGGRYCIDIEEKGMKTWWEIRKNRIGINIIQQYSLVD